MSTPAIRNLCRSPGAIVGAFLLSVVVCAAIMAPWLAPASPTLVHVQDRLLAPLTVQDGMRHWLGTDALGRDVLSRLLVGARISLFVGLTAVAIGGSLGTAIGLVSGYHGSWTDRVIMRFGDMQLAFPFILLALAVMAVLGPGLGNIIGVLGVTSWVTYARVVRAEVLSVREREYVQSARAMGASVGRILLVHALPNVISTAIVVATFSVASTILSEAGLSFLGLGVGAGTPTWGSMLADAREYVTDAWWLTTFPGLAILTTVLGVNLVGDWLRDYLDPRLR
ncbi:MAG TPA: ABC transporter permease [bacterium]|nr:ABC transporter permease [bacterium]